MLDFAQAQTPETLEVDIDHFTALYAIALQGTLPPDEEDEILEVASHCMTSDDLDPAMRDFFQSAFFVINKKNKSFIDLHKMNQMVKSGEIGCKS